jgi:prepilin peptidase CpaA
LIFLWAFAAAVAYSDLRYRRVSNRFILAAMAAALALAACGGWDTLRCGFAGLFLGFLLLLPAFILRMVGGGDVKSLAVIGLIAGPGLLWTSFLCGAAAGGLAAVALIAARRLRRANGGAGGMPARAGSPTLPYAAILSLSAAICALFI